MDYDENFTCCFTGHRLYKLPFGSDEGGSKCQLLKSKLREEIVLLIEKCGVTHFISGMAQGTDMIAAEIILNLERDYPFIKLECVLPCGTQSQNWNQLQKDKYFNILKQCHKVTLLQPLYTIDCMQKRNEYMVDHSDYVIGVWNGTPSGTANTIAYAKFQQKKIVCIDPRTCKDKFVGFQNRA